MKGMIKFNNRIEDLGILKLPLFTLSRVVDVASHSLFDRLFFFFFFETEIKLLCE